LFTPNILGGINQRRCESSHQMGKEKLAMSMFLLKLNYSDFHRQMWVGGRCVVSLCRRTSCANIFSSLQTNVVRRWPMCHEQNNQVQNANQANTFDQS